MTVFNMYNLCKMPCNVACCDYSHLYEYLIKHHQLLVKRLFIYINYKLNI